MSEGYSYILPHGSWVNLGFYKGVDLDDPDALLEGTGAKMRHVKIRSIDDADRPAVEALIQEDSWLIPEQAEARFPEDVASNV